MTTSKWLSSAEQRMWRRHLRSSHLVELAVERDLQNTARISTADYSVLVVLSEQTGPGMRARDLGNVLLWDRSRVSHQVRRMEGRGLVTKRRAENDGRGMVVELTVQGRRLIESASPAHIKMVRKVFIDQLSEDEITILDKIYSRIIDNIEDGSHIPLN